MSSQTGITAWITTNDRDVTIAKLGVLLSVLLFGLQFLAYEPLIVTIPVATGTGSALYLGTRRRRVRSVELPTLPGTVAGYLPALVIAGLAAFVLLVRAAGARTPPAYLLAGAISAVILGQILLLDDDRLAPGLVLLQILLVAVVVRLAGLFVTPGLVGVDAWTHVPVFIEGVVEAGSLSAMSDVKYVMAPIYHVYGAIAALVFGSARTGLYLTLGLVIPLSAVLIYGAGRWFVPARWALLATALFAFADQVIRWGMFIIPNSLALVFFLVVLYATTRLLIGEAEWWAVLCLLLFAFAVVFTHQLSTAVMAAVLGVASVVALWRDLVGEGAGRGITASTVALIGTLVSVGVVTLVSWANTPFNERYVFLWRMLDVLFETLFEQAGFLNLAGESGPVPRGQPDPTLLDLVVPYVDLFGFALLLAVGVVGGLVMLRWDRPAGATGTYLLSAFSIFTVIFGLSIFGVRVFLPGRWLAFLYAFLAIIAAIGLHYVFQTASRRVILVIALVLCLGYPTTMVIGEKATPDSPFFEDQQTRFSYTESEIAAVETMGTILPAQDGEQRIESDHPYHSVYRRYGGYETGIVGIGDGGAESFDPVVYRDYQTSGTAKFQGPDDPPGFAYSRPVEADAVCQPERNVVYANDDVHLCTLTGVTSEEGS